MITLRAVSASAAIIVAVFIAPAAQAQTETFEGPYAGPFAGALEHHFYIETTDLGTGNVDGRYYRDWDLGGGAMVGYDLSVNKRLRIGAEGAVIVGGGSPKKIINGALYKQNEGVGYRLSAKVGLVATSQLMFFIKGGYGGDRFEIDNQANIANATPWRNSFVIGTGAQIRLDPRIEMRLEYEHLDNSSHAFFIGLPIRF